MALPCVVPGTDTGSTPQWCPADPTGSGISQTAGPQAANREKRQPQHIWIVARASVIHAHTATSNVRQQGQSSPARRGKLPHARQLLAGIQDITWPAGAAAADAVAAGCMQLLPPVAVYASSPARHWVAKLMVSPSWFSRPPWLHSAACCCLYHA